VAARGAVARTPGWPRGRKARARSPAVQKLLAGHKDKPRKVLEGLLARFEDGNEDLDSDEVLRMPPFDKLGTPVELVRSFGGRPKLEAAVQALEEALYSD